MPLQIVSENSQILKQHPEWAGHNYIHYEVICEATISETPDIELPADISLEALEAALGFKPLFANVPILKVDVTSRNGNIYKRTAVEALVSQINNNRVEGQWGHLGFLENSHQRPPAIKWLAAVLDENSGIAYGKALLIDEAAIRHFKVAEATHSKIGVSLFGIDAAEDSEGGIAYFNLVTVDLVNSQMVGVPIATTSPKVTKESLNLEETMTEEEKAQKALEEAAKAAAKPAAKPEDIVTEIAGVGDLKREIRTLREVESNYDAIIEMFELAGQKPDVVLEMMKQNATELEELRRENGELLLSTIQAAVDSKIKMESARPLIVEMVQAKKPVTRTQVAAAVAEVMARPTIKGYLQETVVKESGGKLELPLRHEVGGDSWKKFLKPQKETAK